MTHTTESIMALAHEYSRRYMTLNEPQALAALQSAITELVEQLDVQAGSIEAVQAANVRLAAERDMLDQLNNSLKSDVQRAYKDRDALHGSWEAHFGERSFGEVLAERDADKKYIRELEDAVTPELVALRAERDALARDAARYQELIYAVGKKYPDETRHQTALRYIKRMEEPSDTKCAAMKGPTP